MFEEPCLRDGQCSPAHKPDVSIGNCFVVVVVPFFLIFLRCFVLCPSPLFSPFSLFSVFWGCPFKFAWPQSIKYLDLCLPSSSRRCVYTLEVSFRFVSFFLFFFCFSLCPFFFYSSGHSVFSYFYFPSGSFEWLTLSSMRSFPSFLRAETSHKH